MNPKTPTLVSSSRNPQARFRLLPFTASRIGKLAACLILGVATLSQSARSQTPGPVGQWLTGSTNLTDVSGYTPTNTHDAYVVGPGAYGYAFVDDKPVGMPGQSLSLNPGAAASAGDTGLAIANSALSDSSYVSTFDDGLHSAFTVSFWAKGIPDSWNPWVSKNGDTGGWQIRKLGWSANIECFTMRGNTGNNDDAGASIFTEANNWHNYTCTYDAATGLRTMWLDGQQALLWTNSGPYTLSSSSHLAIGVQDNGGFKSYFVGNIYDVRVYNYALSSNQVQQVIALPGGVAPVITAEPQTNIYATAGSAAVMSASALGSAPLAYQWQLNGTNVQNLVDGTNFSGGNSPKLTILNMTPADAGSYQLIITNTAGATNSSSVAVAIQSPALVGQWLDGTDLSTNLVDVSGYSLAAAHDAMVIGGVNCVFTNDVPPGKTGQSLLFYNGDTGLAISNSSTLYSTYDNTFDGVINNTFTVACWTKGTMSAWVPWVSKFGEGEAGWQLRVSGIQTKACFTIRDNGAGTGGDDMAASTASIDEGWHFYVGTFNAGTGERCLYVDGVLDTKGSNDVPYVLAEAAHLCIGAKDSSAGNTFGSYHNGNIFDVRVYNYALISSQIKQIYGILPPTITSQPQSVSSFTGLPAQMHAAASGTQPFEYQWQLNGANIQLLLDSTNFTGANSNTLSILNVTTNDAGSYHLIVTSTLGYGTATSSNATLAIKQRALVGEWVNGTTSDLTDVSGHSPAGTHDGYAAAGGPAFVDDVPAYRHGQALSLDGSTGIAIANSATGDGATYTNTFDETAFTVAFWAKGFAGGGNWAQYVSKAGDNGYGWEVGLVGWSQTYESQFQGSDQGGITYTVGDGLWGNTIVEAPHIPDVDGKWHFYAVTYSAVTRTRGMWYDATLVANQLGLAPYNSAALYHLCIGCTDGHAAGVNSFDEFATTKMYDVRFYNYDLSSNQIAQLFGIPDGIPPQLLALPPASITASCQGITVQINASVGGSPTITNRWQFNGTNLVDGAFEGAIISGSSSSSLTIFNVTTNNQGVYTLTATNGFGGTNTSGTTLTVGSEFSAPAPAANLVGEWLTGSTNLADVSGYTPAGTHDGYIVGGVNYQFTSDVPPGMIGKSLYFNVADTAVAIKNSATVDGGYTNTFDDTITNEFTVTCWAKGTMGGWCPWISKRGDTEGWRLCENGGNNPTLTLRGTGGNDDMTSSVVTDDNWHHYAGVYSAVTGIRSLFVDGVLVVQQTGEVTSYTAAPAYHLCIGAEEGGWWGSAPGAFSKFKVYDVRVYNTALSTNQVNSFLIPTSAPVFSGPPVLNGNKFVLTYTGTLLSATNVAGPYLPVAGATSPYTNNVTTAPQMFYKLSNP